MRLTPNLQPYTSPHVVGEVWRWNNVPSAHLKHPRDVLVWLPPGYHHAPDRRYPVLYLTDGQNKFDPNTSFAGDDWNVDGTTHDLVLQGAIEPPIMVAVYNTPDRIPEYNPLDRGRNYGRFIVEELKPIIDQEFRTQPGRRNALMGSSMGGLISLALLWWYPQHFFGAACFSPSLWILRRAGGPVTWLRRQPTPPQPTRIYMDHGTVGYEGRGASLVRQTLDYLSREVGFAPVDINYVVAEGGDHNEASWRARVAPPMQFLFPPNPGHK
jgi:enterochelin esterase-like enzyme